MLFFSKNLKTASSQPDAGVNMDTTVHPETGKPKSFIVHYQTITLVQNVDFVDSHHPGL